MDDELSIKYLIACTRLSLAVPGWDSPATLHDVVFEHVIPGDREWPALLDELWLYVRFYNGVGEHWFGLSVVWLDPPTGGEQEVVYFEHPVVFPAGQPTHSRGWRMSAVRYPGPGRYVFRLTGADPDVVLAEEYISIRRDA